MIKAHVHLKCGCGAGNNWRWDGADDRRVSISSQIPPPCWERRDIIADSGRLFDWQAEWSKIESRSGAAYDCEMCRAACRGAGHRRVDNSIDDCTREVRHGGVDRRQISLRRDQLHLLTGAGEMSNPSTSRPTRGYLLSVECGRNTNDSAAAKTTVLCSCISLRVCFFVAKNWKLYREWQYSLHLSGHIQPFV